jgi:dTMP kinase
LISEIIQLATEGLKPDLTVLFDLSVIESNMRTRRRASDRGDRLDSEASDFHVRVRDAYLKLAAAEPERIKVVETASRVEETQERLREIVIPFLIARGHLSGAAGTPAVLLSQS